MLAPETRVLLTDALRPPDGYRVDLAVATTYSLDLTALLLAPMTFALHDTSGADLGAIDAIALLEALRRYSDRTTVFCQAGGIHLPPSYSPLMQFLESAVCQVTPTDEKRLFHPKVWMIRFSAHDGSVLHRVLVLSRNLTYDRCWDTLLRLDELGADDSVANAPDNRPLVDFLSALPGLGLAELDQARLDQVRSLATTLAQASFAVPDGFTTLGFLPLGLRGASPYPFPAASDRALLISPFLGNTAVAAASRSSKSAILLSRPESIDRIRTDHFDDRHEAWTLQRPAEVEVGEDPESAQRATHEGVAVRDGLHAKTFVFEEGKKTTIVSGSANLTSAAFGGNVEFDVILTGPTATVGIDSLWGDGLDSPGLARLAERYVAVELTEVEIAQQQLELDIDWFHVKLAGCAPTLEVTRRADNAVDLNLTFTALPDGPGVTHVRPVSIGNIHARPVTASSMTWNDQSRRLITSFLAVETTAGAGSGAVTKRAVVNVVLTGDIGNRRQLAMTEILRNQDDVLRYLSLLLGDPSLDVSFGGADQSTRGHSGPQGNRHDIVVLEPLLKASQRDEDALRRVASLMAELPTLPNGAELVPEGFTELWDAVWGARKGIQGD